MVCNICGKEEGYLNYLTKDYKTDDIQQVCDKCLREVNDHLWKLRRLSNKMNESWVRQFAMNLKRKYSNK